MNENDVDRELAEFFSRAERSFESDAARFSGEITSIIKKRQTVRRLVISSFALLGGLIASFQIPIVLKLLDQFVGLNGQISAALEQLNTDALDLSVHWTAAIIVGVGVFFTTLMGETN